MKQRAITIAGTKGYPAAAAKLIWQKVRDNCGAEPTAEMLADYDQAAYEKAGVAPPLAKAWSEAFRVVKRGKFRPGKPYTGSEYVAFYASKMEPDLRAALIAAINLACENKPWVVFTDKFHPEQSAQYIDWHLNEDNAPATIDVDGEPVTPVMPGEEKVEKVKLYWVDPHTPGGFLTVEMKSPRTNADFSGYVKNMGAVDEDTSAFQAMIFLCGRDLKPETPRSLKLHAEECRGSSARDILSDYAETLAAWNKLPADQRPKAKMAKEKAAVPFAEADRSPVMAAAMPVRTVVPEPKYNISITGSNVGSISVGAAPSATGSVSATAARPGVPVIHFLTGGVSQAVKAAEELKTHLATARRNGTVVLTDDYSALPGTDHATHRARLLSSASIVLAMVCARTLADDGFDASLRRGARMIPVVVSACDWVSHPNLGLLMPLDLSSGESAVAQGILAAAQK